MERWEYHVETLNGVITSSNNHTLQTLLNRKGAEGWELVNIIPQIGSKYGESTVDFNQLVFKRVKDNAIK